MTRRLGVIRTLVSPRWILGVALVWGLSGLHAAAQVQQGFGLTVRKACDGLPKQVGDTLDCEAQAEYADLNLDVTVLTSMVDLIPKGAPNPPGGISLAAKIAKPDFDALNRNAIHGNAACSGGGCDPVTGIGCTLPCILGTQFDGRSAAGLTLPGADAPGSVFFKHDDFEVRETDCVQDNGGLAVTDQVEATFNSACLNGDTGCDPGLDDTATASRTTPCEVGCPFVEVGKTCRCEETGSDPPYQAEVTVTVRNDSEDEATNCAVVDTVDATTCISESIPTLQGGSVEVFTCMTPPYSDPLTNQVTVTCDPATEPNNPECQTTDTDTVQCPICPTDTVVNDFKCYKVKTAPRTPRFDRRFVTLSDQFRDFTTATVFYPNELCAPVDKNGEGIDDPNAHLLCYKLFSRDRRAKIGVIDVDQFFTPQGQELSVGIPGIQLCLPAIKNAVGDLNQLGLNHFLCYRARVPGADPRDPNTVAVVDLTDQFESVAGVSVLDANLHCNPVIIKDGQEVLRDPNMHLKCYPIEQEAAHERREVTTLDQWGPLTLRVGMPTRLCEPASKELLEVDSAGD
jgi:hypothetical protein